MTLTLHQYETHESLHAGWDCSHCHAPLLPGADHWQDPLNPDAAYCSPDCAEAWAGMGKRAQRNADPRQVRLIP